MTPAEAREIADEHIAWWQRAGVSPQDAIVALTRSRWWAPEWWMVRGWIVDWLLRQ